MPKFHILHSKNAISVSFDENWDHQSHAEKFGEKLLVCSEKMHSGPWAFIDDIRNWSVKTPKEIDLCINLAIELSQKGLTHCVVCVDDNALSKWMMHKIVPNEIKIVFFPDIAQCNAWVQMHNFEVPELPSHEIAG